MNAPTDLPRARSLLILGPQGSGKGTQGALLAGRLGIPAISVGALFRAQVSDGTILGRLVDDLVRNGQLVPDGIAAELVRERLQEPDASGGFLLDGFPRTSSQAALLEEILSDAEASLDAVLVLELPEEESIRRLEVRAGLEGRADDTHDAVVRRLRIYRAETEPLLEQYGRLVVRIDGTGTVDEVAERLLNALAAES